jgi:hypothetical protein
VRTVASLVPAAMWLSYFGLLAVAFDVGWSVELWGGIVCLTGLTGLGLSVLAVPPAVPVPATTSTVDVPEIERIPVGAAS